MSIARFEDYTSYVIRSLPAPKKRFRIMDKFGRTKEEIAFLDQFDKIFMAAAKGDLAKCKEIVGLGFQDFNACCYGRYKLQSGELLKAMSPLQVAELGQYQNIVEFFISQMNQEQKLVAQAEKKYSEELAIVAAKQPPTLFKSS